MQTLTNAIGSIQSLIDRRAALRAEVDSIDAELAKIGALLSGRRSGPASIDGRTLRGESIPARVLDMLTKADGAIATGHIVAAMGKSRAYTHNALSLLCRTGRIRRTGFGFYEAVRQEQVA